MSPATAFHTQLASIMEVLANTAVAEICELVDGGYAVLQLEISRSRKENETLRRKLRVLELRAARATAMQSAAAANRAALLRARAPQPAHHLGNELRRSRMLNVRDAAALSKASRCRDVDQSSDSEMQPDAGKSTELMAAVIKVEDDDESLSQSRQEKHFCHVVEGQQTETEALPLLTKQEVAENSSVSLSWTGGDISSNSSEQVSYDCLMYESQVQHNPCSNQNPLHEDLSCSYLLNTSDSISGAADSGSNFPFTISEANLSIAEHPQPAGFHDGQQRAPLSTDELQLPAGKGLVERQRAFIRRDGWRRQHGGGKAYVCNYCGKTLACLKNLKTHMRVHTGEKPFVCTLCSKCFSDSSNLKRHQSVHTGEKRYGCVHCGKRFAQSGSLKVHMTVHTDCKQFRCSYCGKTFISGSHLRRHITVHAGEKHFVPVFQ